MKLFYTTFFVSRALVIAGFVVPPMGVIDGSVLTAVGLLLMFAVIAKLPEAIKAGRSIKIKKDDVVLEVTSKDSEPTD